MSQPGSFQPHARASHEHGAGTGTSQWPWTPQNSHNVSYLVASTGAGLVLAGTGGGGAILLVSGSLVGSILAGAGSSGEKQEQGWGWDQHCQTREGQEALPARDIPWPKGPVSGTSLSFRLLQPRTHPVGPCPHPPCPSLWLQLMGSKGAPQVLGKDPCCSLSQAHISPTPAPLWLPLPLCVVEQVAAKLPSTSPAAGAGCHPAISPSTAASLHC